MNDRFKFRVWDKKEKRFIDHPQINPLFGCVCGYENSTYPLQIEQCTGLSDKNGNLIYENDLIITPNNSHKLAIIRMENGVYGCKECRFNGVWEMNLYDLVKHYGVEIIGTIHDTDIKEE